MSVVEATMLTPVPTPCEFATTEPAPFDSTWAVDDSDCCPICRKIAPAHGVEQEECKECYDALHSQPKISAAEVYVDILIAEDVEAKGGRR